MLRIRPRAFGLITVAIEGGIGPILGGPGSIDRGILSIRFRKVAELIERCREYQS